MKDIVIFIIVLSIFCIGMGGISDMTGERYCVSKEHWWADGQWLLLLAGTLLLLNVRNR